jgi:hypothetical protein
MHALFPTPPCGCQQYKFNPSLHESRYHVPIPDLWEDVSHRSKRSHRRLSGAGHSSKGIHGVDWTGRPTVMWRPTARAHREAAFVSAERACAHIPDSGLHLASLPHRSMADELVKQTVSCTLAASKYAYWRGITLRAQRRFKEALPHNQPAAEQRRQPHERLSFLHFCHSHAANFGREGANVAEFSSLLPTVGTRSLHASLRT